MAPKGYPWHPGVDCELAFWIWLWWYPSCMLSSNEAGGLLNHRQFANRRPDELQFWLRGPRIAVTLISFQITASVESQPAAVVSEDTCV